MFKEEKRFCLEVLNLMGNFLRQEVSLGTGVSKGGCDANISVLQPKYKQLQKMVQSIIKGFEGRKGALFQKRGKKSKVIKL